MKVTRLNEEALYEGPISWIKNKLDPLNRARGAERAEPEKAVKNARKVLAKDFSKDAADYKFYLPGTKTPLSQDKWKSMFLNIEPDDVETKKVNGKDPDAKLWWNSCVTTRGGYLVRRGAEVISSNITIDFGKNDKVKDNFAWPYKEVEEAPAEEPSEDTPAEDTVVDDGSITETMLKKFIQSCKVLSKQLYGEFDGSRKKIDVDKYDSITVEQLDKIFVKSSGGESVANIIKNNKTLYEGVELQEAMWKHNLDQNLANRFRTIIRSDETDYVALREVMKDIYDAIYVMMEDEYDEYDRDSAKEELDYISTEVDDFTDEEELEDEWNNALSDLYDVCDMYRIWIPLENLDEGSETLTEESAWDKLVKAYPELEEEGLSLNEDEEFEEEGDDEGEDEILTEAPIVTLNDDDLMNPSRVDFKDKIAKATAEEEAAKAKAERDAKIAELRVKYADLLDKVTAALDDGKKPSDVLEILFDALVPAENEADTVAGELTRAMMRLLYRAYNDGDVFFQGYGLETCASSAAYLYDMGIDTIIDNILDNTEDYDAGYDDNSHNRNYERYLQILETLTRDVINHILENPDLISEPNDTDSRGYDSSYIEEKEPKYEFEVPVSDDVNTLLDHDVVNAYDLQGYVEESLEYDSRFNGCEFSIWDVHSNTVTVSELSLDAYNELNEMCSYKPNKFHSENKTHLELFWEGFVEQYADELNEIENGEEDYDEFEDDDDYDNDDDLGEAFNKTLDLPKEEKMEECNKIEEAIERNFTTYDETVESMMGNDDEEVKDAHLRMLDRIVKVLGTSNNDMVIYIDTENMYNPAWYCEPHNVKNINRVLTQYDFDGIVKVIARKSGRGDCVIYFKNINDANQYMRFVDKENGIV